MVPPVRVIIVLASITVLGGVVWGNPDTAAASSEHWSYTGQFGPEHWEKISKEFETCGTGRVQSPFDIKSDIGANLPSIAFRYNPMPLKVVHNGHTIKVPADGRSLMQVDGVTYKLLQFHFHTPSEYTIDGKSSPMEAHLVHVSERGQIAVVGVMIEEGEANTELAKVWKIAPRSSGESVTQGVTIDASALLPGVPTYFRFMGSLTTPPCTEGIDWYMMAKASVMSKDQITAFREIFPLNARPLQPENNRLVVKGK